MLECMLSPEWSDWKTCAAMRAFATAVIRMHSFLARTSDTLPTPALVRCFLFWALQCIGTPLGPLWFKHNHLAHGPREEPFLMIWCEFTNKHTGVHIKKDSHTSVKVTAIIYFCLFSFFDKNTPNCRLWCPVSQLAANICTTLSRGKCPRAQWCPKTVSQRSVPTDTAKTNLLPLQLTEDPPSHWHIGETRVCQSQTQSFSNSFIS